MLTTRNWGGTNGVIKIRPHNIVQLKEEKYQYGFLREIFVDILCYTVNPYESYNLTTEYKKLKDARKADENSSSSAFNI